MVWVQHETGASLLQRLQREGLSEAQAKEWVGRFSGFELDLNASYEIRTPEGVRDEGFLTRAPGLRLHIHSDSELGSDDRKYRKYNKLPPRRPWEPIVGERFLGRSQAAVRYTAPNDPVEDGWTRETPSRPGRYEWRSVAGANPRTLSLVEQHGQVVAMFENPCEEVDLRHASGQWRAALASEPQRSAGGP